MFYLTNSVKIFDKHINLPTHSNIHTFDIFNKSNDLSYFDLQNILLPFLILSFGKKFSLYKFSDIIIHTDELLRFL